MSDATKNALLKAIIENPDEDTPRLVFADLLDETDDDHDRAEFIRLQCGLPGADGKPPGCQSGWDREDVLLRQHQERWVAETFGSMVKDVRFWRGFPEECSTTAKTFAQRGAKWCQRTPLRALIMSAVRGRAEQLAACSHLRHPTRLEIRDRRFDDADLTALAGSRHLARLERLTIGHSILDHPTQVTDEGVRNLAAEAEFLPRLKHLSITGNWNLSWYGLSTLAQSKRITGLRELQLMNTFIDDHEVYALAEAGCGLTRLAIFRSQIGNEGLVALATSEKLPTLSEIRLSRSSITPDVFRDLARSRTRSGLRRLDLSCTHLGEVNADELGTLLAARPGLELSLMECGLPHELQDELDRRFDGRVEIDMEEWGV